jgi:ribosomal protein S27AE
VFSIAVICTCGMMYPFFKSTTGKSSMLYSVWESMSFFVYYFTILVALTSSRAFCPLCGFGAQHAEHVQVE